MGARANLAIRAAATSELSSKVGELLIFVPSVSGSSKIPSLIQASFLNGILWQPI
jgi:hypothetical protein